MAETEVAGLAAQQYAGSVPDAAFGIFVLGVHGGSRHGGLGLPVISEAAVIGAVSSLARGGFRLALEGAVPRPSYHSRHVGEGGLLHLRTIAA